MKIFEYINKHPRIFFWISLVYMGVFSVLCEVYLDSEWIHALVLLPINFVTWPVAHTLLGNGRWKDLNHVDRDFVFLLPIMSVVLPLWPLLF